MSDASNEPEAGVVTRPTSLLNSRNMDAAQRASVRNAMAEREGLVQSIFGLLRSVPRCVLGDHLHPEAYAAPRRLLMILKLSDLQR